jgi:GT2 family glycosyltransferase
LNAVVVVVTWRNQSVLLRSLDCLAAQGVAHTTIVVDNEADGTTARLVAERHPAVRVVELAENQGFGRAVNVAARLGDGEAIVLVNDDVEPEPGFLAAILAPLEDDRVGMVAGLTLMPSSGLVDGFGIELDVTLAAYNRLRGQRPDATAGRLAGPSGGAAAYRRTAFEAVGGFDERLFAYGEDVDLALRLRSAGWTASAAAGARGVHLGGSTVGPGSPRQRELAGFARGYMLRRYGVLRSRSAARALVIEALVIGWGLLAHRTTIPLRARLRGWRAGAGARRPIPTGVIESSITLAEAFRRLVAGRTS